MPITSNIFYNGFTDADLLAGIPEGQPTLEYPFIEFNDVSTRLIKQRYHVKETAAFLPLDSQLPAELATRFGVAAADFFLVENGTPQTVCGDIVEIERTYSNMPIMHTEYNNQILSFPGLDANIQQAGTSTEITDFSISKFQNGYAFVYVGTKNVGNTYKAIIRYVESGTATNGESISEDITFSRPDLVCDNLGYIAIRAMLDTATNVSFSGKTVSGHLNYLYKVVASTTVYANSTATVTITSLSKEPYKLYKREPFNGNTRMYTEYSYVRCTSFDELLNVNMPRPYLDDWGVTLTVVADKQSYLNLCASRTPCAYDAPTMSRWKGNIYEIASTFAVLR